ncbi:hypothetical protein HYDPIDRAFT_30319 [Hydnomerulius pinastri MD-312]|uniref:Unplaced genomic scaffold scaffold_20, whole genome shotgun sequence n=1 Tax=Hydnomerulius pinastri MD-312 TaxID=994086 RepID=A0A0C9VX06_9AGAM|nr:hypothetical protein HYDPIDRAFT_30319 [Hydnomerulius pinastri MD-312]
MSCPDCNRGSILEGTPTGSVAPVNGVNAYFASGASSQVESTSKDFAVVLLTDAFGLALVNNKLLADKIAKDLACDVWVPDLFNGCIFLVHYSVAWILNFAFPSTASQPILSPDGMEAQLLPDRAGPWPLWDQIRLYTRIIGSLGVIFRSRPSVVVPRTAEFIKTVREQNKYKKIGGVGATPPGPQKSPENKGVSHPSILSEALISSMDVPTAWACAEQDSAFSPQLRLKAEAIFAARKDKDDFVPYEFKDYKGTAHGFACRPNLAYEDVKAGFEGSLEQTVGWFGKTLAD